MYTVPIKLWVDKLLSKCARTDMTNTFLMPQTMSNSVTLQNNSLDLHEVPSQEHTGATHEVAFTDSHSRPLGKVQAIRTNTDATGVQLEVNGNTLGLQVSDEGIPTSFVNHPYPDGPANQIATMKYVKDYIDMLSDLITELRQLVNGNTGRIDNLLASLGSLSDLLDTIDNEPTENSNHLVKSGGVYSWVLNQINQAKSQLQEIITQATQDLVVNVRPSLGAWREISHKQDNNTGSHYFPNGGFISCISTYEREMSISINNVMVAIKSAHDYAVIDTICIPVPAESTASWNIGGRVDADAHSGCVFVAEYN